jgi:hypothetical protein
VQQLPPWHPAWQLQQQQQQRVSNNNTTHFNNNCKQEITEAVAGMYIFTL